MNVAPEERVNMSLDDLVKASRKSNPKRTPIKKGLLNKKGAPKTPQSAGKSKTKKPQSSDQKIAKKAGLSNAKRNALTNQRRGLNSTGQASKRDIEKAVKKQTNKVIGGRGLLMKGNGRRRKSGGGGGPGLSSPNRNAIATGLKISFKPAELVQTTDKLVMQQIRGALAKSTVTSPSPKKPRARPYKKA